jgi:hypothetical protein
VRCPRSLRLSRSHGRSRRNCRTVENC